MRKRMKAYVREQEIKKKSFEGVLAKKSDTFARIYITMLLSEAWQALSAKQQVLYVYCKSQYYAEKTKPVGDNRKSFTMNQSKWRDLYGIYTLSNKNSFYKDMTALIEKGFIRCLHCGSISRTKSIYEFSDKWQLYGTPEFKILPSEMTLAMSTEERAKKNKDK